MDIWAKHTLHKYLTGKGMDAIAEVIIDGEGKSDYLIAIPSYDRVETLKTKTIALIERNGLPKKAVHIFVANKEEEKKYKDALPDYKIIVAPVKGILKTRNFITKYFKDGQKLVHFDDDIEEVLEKVSKSKEGKEMRKVNLKEFIPKAFAEIDKLGLSMWGVNPVNNPFYMSNNVSTDLRYIVGAFRGIINRHDIILKFSNQKEDVENTIRAFIRDGGVLRYNGITVKTRWYAPGGIVSQTAKGDAEARKKMSKEAVDMLVKAFPAYGTPKQRSNGIWEFVLTKKPKTKLKGGYTDATDPRVYRGQYDRIEVDANKKAELDKLIPSKEKWLKSFTRRGKEPTETYEQFRAKVEEVNKQRATRNYSAEERYEKVIKPEDERRRKAYEEELKANPDLQLTACKITPDGEVSQDKYRNRMTLGECREAHQIYAQKLKQKRCENEPITCALTKGANFLADNVVPFIAPGIGDVVSGAYKAFGPSDYYGLGKPVMRKEFEGADDTSIYQPTIRNRKKYEATKEALLKVLREATIPKIPKPALKTAHTNRGNKLGTIGRTITFGFGDTRRGIKEYASNKRHPELLKALVAFGNQVVPKGFEYNGITLNEGVKAKKHKDSKNVGVSYIIGIGDFTGGNIKVWNKEDKSPKDFDLNGKPVGFNGGLLFHQTTPFTGERYTIIYYKQMWEGTIKGLKTVGEGKALAEQPNAEDLESDGAIFA
jgi:hypothetical protein